MSDSSRGCTASVLPAAEEVRDTPPRARLKNEGDQDSVPGPTARAPVKARKTTKVEKKPFARPKETDAAWYIRYESEYESRSQRSRNKKAAARDKDRARRAATAAREPQVSEDRSREQQKALQAIFADHRREQQKSRQTLIVRRRTCGFEWKGGPFAGSGVYRREPLRYFGLVSDRHPILKLFASKLPKARHLRVGDGKSTVYGTDSKLLGLDAPYVEDNKTVCGVLRIELDAVLAWDDIVTAGVPPPNVVVGWEDAEGLVHHPHLIWLLHDSVPLQGKRCTRFRSLYRGVLRGLTKALLAIGADPGGLLNAHRHKNPLCPLWHRRICAEQPYDLGSLSQTVDIRVRMEPLKRLAAERRASKELRPDHPDPEVAAGSNRLFTRLAEWARQEVGPHRAAGRGEEEFAAMVAAEACRLADALTAGPRYAEAVAPPTAASVANWTWNKYRAPARPPLSSTELEQRRAEGGRKGAERRRTRNQDVIAAAALRLADELGRPPRQAELLIAVRQAGVRGEKTIRRHWPAVRAALAGHEREAARQSTSPTGHSLPPM